MTVIRVSSVYRVWLGSTECKLDRSRILLDAENFLNTFAPANRHNSYDMRDFKAYFIIPAEPAEVYLALTTEITINLWTGEEATMIAEPGTEFSMWSGAIVGKNLSFIKDKEIVQQWYFGENTASVVTVRLHEHKRGTSMEVRHSDIPDEAYEDIADGWYNTYAASLIDFYRE